jgi:hypothetical protein
MTRPHRLAWLAFWLVVGACIWALLIRAAVAVVDSHSPQPWTVPPSAIRSILSAEDLATRGLVTTPSGEQSYSTQPPWLDSTALASAPPRLPRWSGTEADHEVPAASTDLPAARPAASHSLAELVFTGVASTYGDGYGPGWIALPQGPGIRFRVCGPAACLTLVSTDKGPDQRIFPDRIVDLPVWAFERVSGQPWRRGLASVSVEILGRR